MGIETDRSHSAVTAVYEIRQSGKRFCPEKIRKDGPPEQEDTVTSIMEVVSSSIK
jgi:hypothetical protein